MRLNDLALAGLLAWPGQGQVPPGRLESAEDRLLLLALKAGPVDVRDSLPAYTDGAGSCRLPLAGLSRALGLGIRVEGARAWGHVRNPGQTFALDLDAGTVRTGGKTLAVDRSRTEWLDEDIYVAIPLLEAWLDLEIKVDPSRAVAEVTSREELPVQVQWDLDRKAHLLGLRKEAPAEEALPRIASPYALWDPPFLNQTLDARLDRGRKGDLSGSTFLAGDLLHMTSTFHFTSTGQDPVGNVRGALARRDPEGGLLGPLGATVVELGDIHVEPLALVGGTPTGRGVHVGNGLDRWQGQRERTTFRGDLLPGWAVELYQDGGLLRFQRSRTDGVYVFDEVPLRFGLNLFRLVFHGPQGERREETRRFDLRQPLTPRGAFRYQAAALRPGPGIARYQGEFAYGLHRHMDLTVGAAQVASGADTQRFGLVTLQGYLPGFTFTGGAARDLAGGTALTGSLGTGWGPHALTLQHTWLQGFASPAFRPSHGAIRSRSRGQLDLALPFHLTLEGSRDALASGGHINRISALVLGQTRGWSLTNRVSLDRGPGLDDAHGAFRLGRAWSGVVLRGEAEYGMDAGRSRLRTLGFQADTGWWRPWTVQLGWQRILAGGENRFSLQANRFQGRMGLSTRAEVGRSTGYSVGIGLQVSLGWEPRTRRWLPSASPMAFGGAVSAVSHREGGAPAPLEGVSLKIDGTPVPGLSAPAGVIFQPFLGWGRPVSVALNPASIEDPFLKARHPGFSLVPRPGKTVLLDFPLIVSGEVNGTACLLDPDGARPLPGLTLELVDAQGGVQQASVSAFDGFFEMTGLVPGTYLLRVAEREASRLGIILPPSRTLTLTGDEPLLEGISMRAVPLPPEEPPTGLDPWPGPTGQTAPARPEPSPHLRKRATRIQARPPRLEPATPKAPAAPDARPRSRWALTTLPFLAIPFGAFTFHWLRRLRRRSGGTS